MQARALRENEEYILPARFDTTELPGLRETVGYVRLRNRSPKQLADLIASKIGPRQRSDFLPPYPDRLYRRMRARKKAEKAEIDAQLRAFYEAWSRMESDERRVIADLLLHGCPEKLPKNFHINLDLLRRETGFPSPKIEQILGNLSSLGFSARVRQSKRSKELVQQRFVELEFNALTTAVEDLGPHNALLQAICDEFGEEICRTCAHEALLRGDFSQLSSSTLDVEKHGRMRPAAESR
jgi:hypothetical protein